MSKSTSRRSRLRLVSLCVASGAAAVGLVVTSACGSSDDSAPSSGDGGTKTKADGAVTSGGGGGGGGGGGSADGGAAVDAGPALLPFKPSNFDLTGIDVSAAGDVDITGDCVFSYTSANDGTTSCGVTSFVFAYLQQGDMSPIGVFIAKSIKVEAGVNITSGVGTISPIVLVSLGTFDVAGQIDISADGIPGGRSAGGASFSGSMWNSAGIGDGGGGAGSATNAGGGGSYCGIGGKGSAFGDAGTSVSGGATYGSALLVPLVGGSTGGVGGSNQNGGAAPGSGGGALQLVAGTSFTLEAHAAIGAGGGPGHGAIDSMNQAAGGGSGGAILIEAPTVTLAGTLSANGGGGGGGYGGTGTGAGLAITFAGGGDNNGGAGNGALPGDAGKGVPATLDGIDGTPNNGEDPGAGGGGAGRIRINTTSGKATITGILSPDVTSTMCVTQGTVTAR